MLSTQKQVITGCFGLLFGFLTKGVEILSANIETIAFHSCTHTNAAKALPCSLRTACPRCISITRGSEDPFLIQSALVSHPSLRGLLLASRALLASPSSPLASLAPLCHSDHGGWWVWVLCLLCLNACASVCERERWCACACVRALPPWEAVLSF